jgi:hypothetical protein
LDRISHQEKHRIETEQEWRGQPPLQAATVQVAMHGGSDKRQRTAKTKPEAKSTLISGALFSSAMRLASASIAAIGCQSVTTSSRLSSQWRQTRHQYES